MSFLLVDRILALEPPHYIQGIKHVTLADSYLYRAQDGYLALLPSIIGETLGQLGAWGALHLNGFTRRPVAGIVPEVHLHADAHVGDTILLDTYLDDCTDESLKYHGIASVRGKPVFTIKSAIGPMLPVSDFIDTATLQQQFANIYRPGTRQEDDCGPFFASMMSHHEKSDHYLERYVTFDRILEIVPHQYAVAQKLLSLSAPYFVDHFPRKPVLPLTILLHCKLQLARKFLEQTLQEECRQFKPAIIRKIKMNAFVHPGDLLTTRMEFKQCSNDEIIISFRSEVAAKRVCIAEALFTRVEVSS